MQDYILSKNVTCFPQLPGQRSHVAFLFIQTNLSTTYCAGNAQNNTNALWKKVF